MIYRFGPFALDSTARRLTRDGDPVPLSDRHVDVLVRLLANPGEVVPKEALVQAAWPDVAVTDNSLEQAVSMLRKALAVGPDGTSGSVAIETIARRGYRLAATVTREASRYSDAEIDALLAPHRAWLEGRAALEQLSVQQVGVAERAFRSVLAAAPDHAAAHVGLANALVFRFECSRIDERPDAAGLPEARAHARDACRLSPQGGEAWATLGFVLHRNGDVDAGIAAIRRAIALEPDNWRHHLRLAFTCWGEARLRAAQSTLQLLPGLALAHWLAASVHVARQAFDAAERQLTAGAVAQDQQVAGAMFGGIGLHWLSGLLALRRGDTTTAEEHFERELAFEPSGHLYARECCSATWYAKGAVALHHGDRRSADVAFGEVLRRVPRHPFALAAHSGTTDGELAERIAVVESRGGAVDAAIARAVHQVSIAAPADVAVVLDALGRASAGSSGWYLPVEPMLRPWMDVTAWAHSSALLRSRAA